MTLDLQPVADCVDGPALYAAIESRLPADALPHLSVLFAPGDPPVLQVQVDDVLVWSRPFPLAPEDCAHAPDLVALSVQRGLSLLPGLPWDPEGDRNTVPWQIVPGLMSSLGMEPLEPRTGLQVSLGLGADPVMWLVTTRLSQGAWFPVGDGEARYTLLSFGLGVERAFNHVFLSGLGLAGPTWAAGRGFLDDRQAVGPRISGVATLGASAGPIRAGLETEVAILKVVAREPAHDVAVPESVLRLGVSVAVGLGGPDR